MMATSRIAWSALLALASVAVAQVQAPSGREIGAVTAVDATARTIAIRTDSGSDAVVRYDEKTSFRKIAPGEKDLNSAAVIEAGQIAQGDRVVARGIPGDDGKTLNARSVIVMAKADVARKQAADRAEWDRRGIGGVVVQTNPQAKELILKVPGAAQTANVTIALAEGAQIRRYAPESVRFSDAKPSTIEEVGAGDQVRALGTKSPDGSRFVAEELVSGSFVNIAATVDSVDAAARTMTVTDLATKKKVVVRLTPDSAIRRLPPFAANMLANRANGANNGMAGPARPAQGPQGRREGVTNPLTPSGAGGPVGMRERPHDLQTMLERMPSVPLTELKTGDAVIIASTRGADPSHMTAINILSGVEPLLAAPDGGRQSLGSWNLDLNMNMSLP